MEIDTVVEIAESQSITDIKFVCIGVLPNWSEEQINELEQALINKGWRKTKVTLDDPLTNGCMTKSDTRGKKYVWPIRIRNIKHVQERYKGSMWNN